MKNFWNGLKPMNRSLIIGGVILIIVVSMFTGYFDAIIGLLPGGK
jgi:type II secretory pathway component PulM